MRRILDKRRRTGLGLGIVNDIVSKYKNVILNTCADDSKFRQELIINL